MNLRESFLVYCAKFVGIPYIWGGDNIKVGVDCSGLVQMLLARLNLDPEDDQTADDLMRYFKTKGKIVDINDIGLGDLIFFGALKSRATHIAMGLVDGLIIEAGGGGSKCTTVEYARKIGAQVRIRLATDRSDVICVIRPNGLPF